jgi:hypothetical protein
MKLKQLLASALVVPCALIFGGVNAFAEEATPENAARIEYVQALEKALSKYNPPPGAISEEVQFVLGSTPEQASLPDDQLNKVELAIRYGNIRPAKADEGNGYGSLFNYDVDANGREIESGVYYYYADTIASNHAAGFLYTFDAEERKKANERITALEEEFSALGSPGGDFVEWYKAQVTAAPKAIDETALGVETAPEDETKPEYITPVPLTAGAAALPFKYGGFWEGQNIPSYTVTAEADFENGGADLVYRITSFTTSHTSASGLTFTPHPESIDSAGENANTTITVSNGNGYTPTWSYRAKLKDPVRGVCEITED